MKSTKIQQASNDIGLELAQLLNKAETEFGLSQVLQDYYSYSENEFTFEFRRSDGTLIARFLRKYSSVPDVSQYNWVSVPDVSQDYCVKQEGMENTEMEQTSNNMCREVVEVLTKAGIMCGFGQALHKYGLLPKEPQIFKFVLRSSNKTLGITPVKCPCFPGATWCCQ